MAGVARDVEQPLAAQLLAAATVMELQLTQANIAAGRLVELLTQARHAGHSVRALSDATGLSPKSVRTLLR